VDILLLIPLCLGIAGHNGLINLSILRISKSDGLYVGMKEMCHQLLDELQKWWKYFESSQPRSSPSLFAVSGLTSLEHQESPDSAQYSPTVFIHRDTLTSFSVSLYNAANLILHTVLQSLSTASERLAPQTYPFNDPKYHLKQVVSHSQSILHIVAHHQDKRPNAMDIMRSTFPLKIVELLSPPEQSTQAKALAAKSAFKRPDARTSA